MWWYNNFGCAKFELQYKHIQKYNKKLRRISSELLQLTGVPGIEPGSGVLETLILPMNYTPKCDVSLASDYNSIQNSSEFVNSFLRKSTHISAKTQQRQYAKFMRSFCWIIIQPLPLVVLWSDGNKPVFCLPHAASSKLLRLLQGIVCAETDMDTK